MTHPTTNGHPNGSGPVPPGSSRIDPTENLLQELVGNALMIRQGVFRQLTDPRRSIADECGYPDDGAAVAVELFRQLYDREAVATRIVQVMPKESWQVTPHIYEDEDSRTATPFEQAWDDLEVGLSSGKSWHQDEQGSTIWEHLLRADILSGIGAFGLLLIGIDDGRNLQDPVEGVITVNHKTRLEQVYNAAGKASVKIVVERVKGQAMPDSPARAWENDKIRAMLDGKTVTVNHGKWDQTGYHEDPKVYAADFLNSPWQSAESLAANANAGLNSKAQKNAYGTSERPPAPQSSSIQPAAGNMPGEALGGMGQGPVNKDSSGRKVTDFTSGHGTTSDGRPVSQLSPTDQQYAWQPSAGGPPNGTDSQYFGVQMGASEAFPGWTDKELKERRERKIREKLETQQKLKARAAKSQTPPAPGQEGADPNAPPAQPGQDGQPPAAPPEENPAAPPPAAGPAQDPTAAPATTGKSATPKGTTPLPKPDAPSTNAGDEPNRPEKFTGPAAALSSSQEDDQGGNLSDSEMEEGNPDQEHFDPDADVEAQDVEVELPKRKLLFLRSFDETLVQVVRWEWNPRNPRFGMPVMYRITLNDPREQHTGVGLPLATVFVHWSRVVHLADNLGNSEVMGVPRMRPVLNRVLDLRKLYSGSAEMYWRGAFPGWSLETNPQMGPDVIVDKDGIRDMMEKYTNSLQRYLVLIGMSAKSMAPQVVDPTQQIDVQLTAICIQLGIPKRVFMGSERGELASSQDDSAFNDRIRHRQQFYLTPKVIVPFIDRLIALEVLPEPEGYTIQWPDIESLSEKDKAAILLQRTQAYGAYISGGLEATIPPLDYMTRFDSMEEEEALEVLGAARSLHEQQDTMTMAPMIGGQEMAPLPGTAAHADKQMQAQRFEQQTALKQQQSQMAADIGKHPMGPEPVIAGGMQAAPPPSQEEQDDNNGPDLKINAAHLDRTADLILNQRLAGIRERLSDLTERLAVNRLLLSGTDILPQPRQTLDLDDVQSAAAYVTNRGGDAYWDGMEAVFQVDNLEASDIHGLLKFVNNCKETGTPGPCKGWKQAKAAAAAKAAGGAPPVAPPPKPAPAPAKLKPLAKAKPVAAKGKAAAAKAKPPVAPAPAPAPSPAPAAKGKPAAGGAKFSGEKKDSRGYRICFSEGKRIACGKAAKGGAEGGGAPATAPTPAGGAAPAPSPAPAPAPTPAKPEPAKPSMAETHSNEAKGHAAAAGAAFKAGKHDEAIGHAEKAAEAVKRSAEAPDAEDKHKVNHNEWTKEGSHLAKFKEKVEGARKEKVEKEAAAKKEQEAKDKAAKDHEEKAKAAKEAEDKRAEEERSGKADAVGKTIAASKSDEAIAAIKADGPDRHKKIEESGKAHREAEAAHRKTGDHDQADYHKGKAERREAYLKEKQNKSHAEGGNDLVEQLKKLVAAGQSKRIDSRAGERMKRDIANYKHGDQIQASLAAHGTQMEKVRKARDEADKRLDSATKSFTEAMKKYPYGHPERKKTAAEYDSATKAFKESSGRLEQMKEEGRQLLLKSMGIPEDRKMKVNHDFGGIKGVDHMAKAKEGLDFASKLIGRNPTDPPLANSSHKEATKDRACYRPSDRSINTDEKTDVAVHVHEFGHHLEVNVPGMKEASQAFLQHRCGNEPAINLKDAFGGGFADHETGRKDDFGKVFPGVKAYYIGKQYPGGDTEVLSMGIEQLHRDPSAFALRDPEYFKFMIGALRGDLRKGN